MVDYSWLYELIRAIFLVIILTVIIIYARKRKLYHILNLIKAVFLVTIGFIILFIYLSTKFEFFKRNTVFLVTASLFILIMLVIVVYGMKMERSLKKEKRYLKKEEETLKNSGLFNINIVFNVGNKEKHRVKFHYNKFWGNMHFELDDNLIQKNSFIPPLDVKYRFFLKVGKKEKHGVAVVMERPLIFAGFRKKGWKYTILVDDKIMKKFVE